MSKGKVVEGEEVEFEERDLQADSNEVPEPEPIEEIVEEEIPEELKGLVYGTRRKQIRSDEPKRQSFNTSIVC